MTQEQTKRAAELHLVPQPLLLCCSYLSREGEWGLRAFVGVVEAQDYLGGGDAAFREAVGDSLFGAVVLDVDFAFAHVYVDHAAVRTRFHSFQPCIRSS